MRRGRNIYKLLKLTTSSRGADRGTGGSVSFSVAVVAEVSSGARLAMVASDLSQLLWMGRGSNRYVVALEREAVALERASWRAGSKRAPAGVRAFKTHRFFSRVADRGTGGSASFSAAVVVEVSAGARLVLDASDLSVNSSG